MEASDKIIEKIKNLLDLAEDGRGDEESQTALLMAQKLMLKYKISQQDLRGDETSIVVKSLSVYKRIFWWEKALVKVIADNFRVMFYLQSSKFPHREAVQRKIMLMGYEEDVQLAFEMFNFATKAMKHYASYYIESDKEGKLPQSDLRKSYYQGFIDGLATKFAEQRQQMQEENEQYALVIQVPQEVQQAFRAQVNGTIQFRQQHTNKEVESYREGYLKGSKLTLTDKYLPEQPQ